MLTQEQIDQIREYVQDKPVEVVYLFGSQALDAARPDSDYDFGVLFEEGVESERRFDLVIDMMGGLGNIVHSGDKTDVVDLNRAPIRFQYEAIKPRNDIYVRGAIARDNFEHAVLTRYLDEMYFMKQLTRDNLHLIAAEGFGLQLGYDKTR